MNDYTPTTEEVRNFIPNDQTTWVFIAGEWRHMTREGFDRWLAEVKAKQDKATTDRIIALLEESHIKYWVAGGDGDWSHNAEFCFACDFIALIKGSVANNATVGEENK